MNWKRKAAKGLIRTWNIDDAHKVREYANRLAIWRKDGQRLTREELQAVKQRVWNDRVAVEVYPAQCDVVNLRHTRHLWSSFTLRRTVRQECHHDEFDKIKCN